MKAFKPLLLSLSVLALACGGAYANDAKNKSDTQAKSSAPQSGSASTGASGSAGARYDFDKADKNKDGQLSRAEFNDLMKGGASAGATAKKDDKNQARSTSKMGDKPGTTK